MSTEEWRPVVGYEGLYEVSSMGRVRSLPRVAERRRVGAIPVSGRILSPTSVVRGGYPAVQLHRAGARRFVTVHSLVAAAFLGPRPVGADICHSDGDSKNPSAGNLRYDSRAGNIADTARMGRIPRGERHHFARLNEALVRDIRAAAATETQTQIAKRLGLKLITVHNVVRRKSWAWL